MWFSTSDEIEGEGLEPEAAFMQAAKELREIRGWTQQQLADRLEGFGIPLGRGTVGKIEAGVRALRWRDALALAVALGTDVAFLGAGGHGQPDVAVTPELHMSSWRVRQWVRGQLYIKLDSEDRPPEMVLSDDEWVARQLQFIGQVYKHAEDLVAAVLEILAEVPEDTIDMDLRERAQQALDALNAEGKLHRMFEESHNGWYSGGRRYPEGRY